MNNPSGKQGLETLTVPVHFSLLPPDQLYFQNANSHNNTVQHRALFNWSEINNSPWIKWFITSPGAKLSLTIYPNSLTNFWVARALHATAVPYRIFLEIINQGPEFNFSLLTASLQRVTPLGWGPIPGIWLTQSRHPVNVPLEGGPRDLKFGLLIYILPFPILGYELLGEVMGAFYTLDH